MIKRLWVDGYKSLKNLEINFSDGVTVFIGSKTAVKNFRCFKHFRESLTHQEKDLKLIQK